MNDQFFPELARRLKREGISTGPVEKDCLPVLADGQAAVLVMPRSTVAFNADVERCPEADSVYDLTFRLSREVYEYTEAMATAPPLVAEGLHEGFRLLADFNGVVLAGQELEGDWGYKFATWRRSPDRTAVESGDYFDGGHYYGAAKQDFACRIKGAPQSRSSGFVGRGGARERTQFSPQAETELSGLCPDEVQESRQYGVPAKAPFSFRGERRGKEAQCGIPEGRSTRSGLCLDDEQLTELYRCIAETLDSGYPITREWEKILTAAANQIEHSVDDLEERVNLSNQLELEAAEQQPDDRPGMEMAP